MSSPREASPCDAVIVRAAAWEDWPGESGRSDQAVHDELPCDGKRFNGGPLRLPRLHQAEFVRQFNQLYRTLGMRLELLPETDSSAAPVAQFQPILPAEDEVPGSAVER